MSVELLPCPFCGAEPAIQNADDGCYAVQCAYCDFALMGGPVGIGWWPTYEAAALAWNHRAITTMESPLPEGWVAVPAKATDAMVWAGCDAWMTAHEAMTRKQNPELRAPMKEAYAAAIAATPKLADSTRGSA